MTSSAAERADLIETLRTHRAFLRRTVEGLEEHQTRTTSTVSELTLASLIKHVSDTEDGWARFTVEGKAALGGDFEPSAFSDGFVDTRFDLGSEDTLASLLATYADVADRTDALAASVDLDHAHALPKAPWFEPGATRSARRVFLHIVAETAQHAGHADIIREAIDGAKTMG